MIKINSELPNCMLGYNNHLNEYDFVLFHLYTTNKDYKDYYLKQRQLYPRRFMIFDNSAYEFYVKGETLNLTEFYEAICELQPDVYILPDVLMNKEETLKGVTEFLDNFSLGITMNTKTTPKPLAVAQGNSSADLLDCLEKYKALGITHIALPFHNSFFKEMSVRVPGYIQQPFVDKYGIVLTEDHMYAMGRVKFVRAHMDLLKSFEHVHFLGSHCPLEKVFYKDFHTMDTGYPVKCAVKGDRLFKEIGKPDVIIDEFLDINLPSATQKLIKSNVLAFRNL